MASQKFFRQAKIMKADFFFALNPNSTDTGIE
jgi:hypothetical protein